MKKPWLSSDDEPFSCRVEKRFHNLRLDQYLALTFEEFSRSHLSNSIKSGTIQVNEVKVKPGYRLKPGDVISGTIEIVSEPLALKPQDVSFEVIEEDPEYLVIAKPPGLVVHPGSGNIDNTLVNGLLFRYHNIGQVGDENRPGIVHRLDKDTSGVMIVARTKTAHSHLVNQFKNRQVEKNYLALVSGVMTEDAGRIVAPIGRHPVHRQKMAVGERNGRHAVSNWKSKKRFARHTLVEVHIETGRTHQIRVHLAHLGHPVAGDHLYGSSRDNTGFPRQMLHAWKLSFQHPATGQRRRAEADLAEDFATVLVELEKVSC